MSKASGAESSPASGALYAGRRRRLRRALVSSAAQSAVVLFFSAMEVYQITRSGLLGAHVYLLLLWLVCGFFVVRGIARVFAGMAAPASGAEDVSLPDYSEFDLPPEREADKRSIWSELGVSPDSESAAGREDS